MPLPDCRWTALYARHFELRLNSCHERLPLSTWAALREDGIMTIEQLSTKADQIHKLPGIGQKTAQLIRDELARVALPKSMWQPS
jgi:hypothetical protein